MSIYIGNTKINNIPIGNVSTKKVYVGEQRIFPDTPIDTFVNNIVNLGGDEDIVREGYSNVPYPVKDKASVMLFPSHTDLYRAYAMDNTNGDALPVYFSRASQGTLFDKNLDLSLVNKNIPRLDYANYSNQLKILFEKESTNLLRDSNYVSGLDNVAANYEVVDNTFGILTKKVDIMTTIGVGAYYYKTFGDSSDKLYTFSGLIKTDFPNLETSSVNSVGTIVVFGTATTVNKKINHLKDDVYMIRTSRNALNLTVRNHGVIKYPNQTNGYLSSLYHQLEASSYSSSYIPTEDTQVTRSADIMKINLLTDSRVYIKTTKEEKYLDKSAGVWNVADDVTESDGILCLAIITDGAFDKDFFDNQFVVGTPIMTSNNTPSPYVTYSNSLYSSSYPAWKVFEDAPSPSRWVTANNTFNSDGTATGTYPYVWLNLGSTANAKKFCKIEVTVESVLDGGYYPRILSLGYSSDSNNYTYQRFSDLISSKWVDGNYILTFFFEAPETAMQYWSLTVIESNKGVLSHIKRLRLFEDVN